MKKILGRIVGCIAVILLVALLFVVALGAIIDDFHEKAAETRSSMVAQGLRNIGELATQSGCFTMVDVYEDARQIRNWHIPFTTTRCIYSYDGVVEAGIDFAEIEYEADDVAKRVTVRLPQVRILRAEVEEDSLMIYDERESIFTPLSRDKLQASLPGMVERIEEQARKSGLPDAAGENAEKLVLSFLSPEYDPDEYEYVFEEKGAEPETPAKESPAASPAATPEPGAGAEK